MSIHLWFYALNHIAMNKTTLYWNKQHYATIFTFCTAHNWTMFCQNCTVVPFPTLHNTIIQCSEINFTNMLLWYNWTQNTSKEVGTERSGTKCWTVSVYKKWTSQKVLYQRHFFKALGNKWNKTIFQWPPSHDNDRTWTFKCFLLIYLVCVFTYGTCFKLSNFLLFHNLKKRKHLVKQLNKAAPKTTNVGPTQVKEALWF